MRCEPTSGGLKLQPMSEEVRKLTRKQELFIAEYLKDCNATAAALRAGYSQASAEQAAKMNMKHPVVGKILNEAFEEKKKRVLIDGDEILKELARVGLSDIRGLFNDDGTVKPVKDWPEALARAVSSIEVEETFEGYGAERKWTGYVKKIKLWSKDRGLELLGKHKKLFTDKIELEGKITLEDLVAGAGSDVKKTDE
jgi:phage terminase small subunit